MPMSIISNVASLAAQRRLGQTSDRLQNSMTRMSTGLRINRAADDTAGLAISERLRSQTRSMAQAERNGMDGISMLQVAEGGMNETSGILARMRELAMQSANDTNSASDRAFLADEFGQLVSEIDRIATVTEFNGTKLLQGNSSTLDFQIGTENTSSDQISVDLADLSMTGTDLSIDSLTIGSKSDAVAALQSIDDAIGMVSEARSVIGSAQNRMQIAVSNLGNMRENLAAADSRIRDADIAQEASQMTRNQILMQSGMAILAQANQQPSMALSLLG